MKSIYRIFCVFAVMSICEYSFTACSDDEEEKEKVFTFAADGTPELIGDNGLDFKAMSSALMGKMIDDSATRVYSINPDGTLTFMNEWSNWKNLVAGAVKSSGPIDIENAYGGGGLGPVKICDFEFPLGYQALYWGEDGIYMVRMLYYYAKWLNYPTNAQEEATFFRRFRFPYDEIDNKIVKYHNGIIGIVCQQADGSWIYKDNITVFPENVAAKMWELAPFEFSEALGDRWNGKPYRNPEL